MSLGSLISAGGSLLGGLFGAKSNEGINKQNAALSKEFAQHGVKWRVDDAKRAGIHPLAALGMPTTSPGTLRVGDSSMSNALADAGQSIGRAVSATSTAAERAKQETLDSLKLERAGLENELLKSQITRVNASATPAFPSSGSAQIDGQGDSVQTVPNRIVAATHGGSVEAGILPSLSWHRNATGGISPQMPRDSGTDSGEIFEPAVIEWWLRNRLNPAALLRGPGVKPPLSALPKGADRWIWSPVKQEFIPSFPSRRRRQDRALDRMRQFKSHWKKIFR